MGGGQVRGLPLQEIGRGTDRGLVAALRRVNVHPYFGLQTSIAAPFVDDMLYTIMKPEIGRHMERFGILAWTLPVELYS